jgi:hypothetical protein
LLFVSSLEELDFISANQIYEKVYGKPMCLEDMTGNETCSYFPKRDRFVNDAYGATARKPWWLEMLS